MLLLLLGLLLGPALSMADTMAQPADADSLERTLDSVISSADWNKGTGLIRQHWQEVIGDEGLLSRGLVLAREAGDEQLGLQLIEAVLNRPQLSPRLVYEVAVLLWLARPCQESLPLFHYLLAQDSQLEAWIRADSQRFISACQRQPNWRLSWNMTAEQVDDLGAVGGEYIITPQPGSQAARLLDALGNDPAYTLPSQFTIGEARTEGVMLTVMPALERFQRSDSGGLHQLRLWLALRRADISGYGQFRLGTDYAARSKKPAQWARLYGSRFSYARIRLGSHRPAVDRLTGAVWSGVAIAAARPWPKSAEWQPLVFLDWQQDSLDKRYEHQRRQGVRLNLIWPATTAARTALPSKQGDWQITLELASRRASSSSLDARLISAAITSPRYLTSRHGGFSWQIDATEERLRQPRFWRRHAHRIHRLGAALHYYPFVSGAMPGLYLRLAGERVFSTDVVDRRNQLTFGLGVDVIAKE